MTTGVVCPHCETRFQLSRDLIGKAMRCPNRDCDEVFVVADADAVAVAPPPPPAPVPVPEFDFAPVPTPLASPPPVLDVDAVSPTAPTLPHRPGVFDAEIVATGDGPTLARVLSVPPQPIPPKPAPPPSVAKRLPGPKEVDWATAGPEAKPPPGTVPVRPTTTIEDDYDSPIRTRAKKKGGLSKVVFWGLVAVLLGTVGATVYMLFLREVASEKQLADEAETLFNDGKYGDAAKRYEQLAAEYPTSESVPKYQFFARFSGVQTSVGAVATRDDPANAQKVFAQFAAEFGDSPLALPKDGYGALVDQVGQKLVTILHDHAADRVKEFRQDRTKPPTALTAADQSVADGLALLGTLDQYRDPTTPAPDSLRAKFDAVTAEVAAERARLATLAPWRTLAADPTEARVEAFEAAMTAAALNKDAEVLRMTAAARRAIRELVRFTPDAVAARRSPGEPKSVAFVAPLVRNSPEPKPVLAANAETIYAVSRGILYALDGHTGKLQWAARVAGLADPRPPEPLVVPLGDGAGEWVIVPTNVDGKPALVARRGRTGEPEWSQPLPAPALGRPARVGGQLFVALQDNLGTVVQIDLRSGEKAGGLELRQRIGTPLAVLPGARPGHAFLVVPGDSRRVFIVEVGREDPNGGRLPPTCVRILRTDHPKDSLLGEPVLAAAADPAAPRRLVLAQKAGTTGTTLRAFGLPNPTELAEVKVEAETPAEQTADVTVPGHIGFSPVSDGERVAVATDTGVFAVFGVAQPGNTDAPLFAVPGVKPAADPDALDSAQVVTAGDDSYWVLAGGRVSRIRKAVTAANGPRLVPGGVVTWNDKPVSLGAAAGRPQLRPALNMAVVTVRPEQADAVHVVAFDLESGEVRWWRQLGAVAAHPPVPTGDGGHLLVDQAGGAYRLSRTAPADGGDPALTATTLAKPLASVGGLPAEVAVSADGKDVWVAVADAGPDGIKLLLRKFTGGKPAGETTLPVPGLLAGPVAVLGDKLLVALSSGAVYRLAITDAELPQGTQWKAGGGSDGRCDLTVTGPDEFLATDGGTRAVRWKWVGDTPQKSGGPWTARNPISRPVTVTSLDGTPHYLIADVKGVVQLFDPTKTTDSVRRWNGTPDGPIPAGAATGPVFSNAKVVVATVDRKTLVALDPSKEAPAWVTPAVPDAGEILGFTPSGTGVLVTYLSGLVREIDPATGAVTAVCRRDPAAGTARVGAVRLSETVVLMPFASGAVGTLPLVPVPR